MDLSQQRKLAAKVLKVSPKRIFIDMAKKDDIKDAITRADVRGLLKDGVIQVIPARGISRGRTKELHHQKSKGLRKGHGSRKGSANARLNTKDAWIARIRVLRVFLYELRDKEIVSKITFKGLMGKANGGFFRNKRHVKVFIEERQLAQKKSGAK
jgi:large subunit ribosomal protein L19e